jgi:hypothetical protein
MKPLMIQELKNRNDPSDLARLLLKALESKHPKNQYRIGTGKLLLLLEILPERWVDASYRLFFRLRR